MKTLEELDKEYQQKRAELESEYAIAAMLPATPDYVSGPGRRDPYVTYKVGTLKEAVALMEKFERIPYVHLKAQFTHVRPEELIDARERERESPKFCHEIPEGTPFLEAQSSSWGASTKLVFWVRAGEKYCHVSIKVEPAVFQWLPHCVFNEYDHVRRAPIRRCYPTVPRATTIQWGGEGEGARATYVWGCDADFYRALTTLPEFQEKADADHAD